MVWLNGSHSVKISSGRSGGISVKFCTSKSFPPYGTKQACLIREGAVSAKHEVQAQL